MRLSLYTTVGIAARKRLYLSDADKVVVAVDGVLESRSSDSELQCLALCLFCQQTVNQTAGERIAATDTVDDRINLITL